MKALTYLLERFCFHESKKQRLNPLLTNRNNFMKVNKYLIPAILFFASYALLACGDDATSAIDDIDEVETVLYGLTVDVEGGETFTFVVDLTDVEGFEPDVHEVYVTGEVFGWTEPGTEDSQVMIRMEDGTDFPESSGITVPAGETPYKYFSTVVGEGWEGGEWDGDPNRTVTIESSESIVDEWGNQPS